MVLAENSVSPCPLDDHHFPYETSVLGPFSDKPTLVEHPLSFWSRCGEAFFEDAEALRNRIGVAEEDGDVVAGRHGQWQVAMGVSCAEWKIHHEP